MTNVHISLFFIKQNVHQPLIPRTVFQTISNSLPTQQNAIVKNKKTRRKIHLKNELVQMGYNNKNSTIVILATKFKFEFFPIIFFFNLLSFIY